MPVRATQHFKLDKKKFLRTGAFDPWLDVDSPLYVDPTLLETCSIPEFAGSRELILKHYESIFHLLVKGNPQDRLWRAAEGMVAFHEMPGIALGHSENSTKGGGIGAGLAATIVKTAKEIISAGVNDPIIFELVGLFEKGVGPDRISDMTCRIVGLQIYTYSERVFGMFNHVPKQTFSMNGKAFSLPRNPYNGEPVLLVPFAVLDELPVAIGYDGIGYVCAHNDALRERLNALLGEGWVQTARKYSKPSLKKFLLENPDLLQELVSSYHKLKRKPYDFRRDPLGELMLDEVRELFEAHEKDYKSVLSLGVSASSSPLDVVKAVCQSVKRLVEEKAMWKLLYSDTEYREPKREEAAQILFAGVAEGICTRCDVDASREPETGRGPVDFKFSRGEKSKVLVEAKLSTNHHLVHAFDTQVRIYQEAEAGEHCLMVVFLVSEDLKHVNKLLAHARENNVPGKTPEIILIDALPKKSASKAKR